MGKSISIVLLLIVGILTSCTNESPVGPDTGKGSVALSFSSQVLEKAFFKTKRKAGFTAYINKFSKAELAEFNTNPLEITLAGNNQDSFTKLFIDGEGIDGKSFIQDNSSLLKQIDIHGSVIKTNFKKNGMSSIYFNGSGNYLSVPDSEDFNFGSVDFSCKILLPIFSLLLIFKFQCLISIY